MNEKEIQQSAGQLDLAMEIASQPKPEDQSDSLADDQARSLQESCSVEQSHPTVSSNPWIRRTGQMFLGETEITD